MFKLFYEQAGDPPAAGGAPSITDPPSTPPAGDPVASAPPPTEPPTGDPASKSWLEGLGDIGKDPSLQMFKEPAALAKSWVNAQKMIGADKVVIPKADAPEADWEAFYNKIGRPESADKYEVKLPDGAKVDASALKSFKEFAHKSGFTAVQVQKMAEWDAQRAAESEKNAAAAYNNQLKADLDEYTKSLGGEEKFKATVDRARIAVRVLADDKVKKFLRDSGTGSRPEFIDFFAKLADMMGEDKIRDGTGVPFKGEDPVSLKREIEELEKKMYSDIGSTNMSSWVEQRSKLYDRLSNLRSGS